MNTGGYGMAKVGYIRVSTIEQNEDRQKKAMEGLGIEKYFFEKVSAKDTNRTELKKMLEYVREGDSIYISDFSRLARSTKDLLNLVEELRTKKVGLISLKENLDTTTPTGVLMLTMIGAINEFERANMLERQREGIAIAKDKGKYKGTKAIEKPKNWAEVYGLYKNRTITGTKAIELLGLKRNTFYKFVNEEKESE